MKTFNFQIPNILQVILSSRLFWTGLVLKIILIVSFRSDIIYDLFLPFLTDSAQFGWKQAYLLHYQKSIVESFPYPLIMVVIFSWPIKIFLLLGIKSTFILSCFIKVILLFCDCIILSILASWIKSVSLKKIMFLYWFSPALIYISYLHGQLDVIPVSLLLISFYFLFRHKIILSSLFFSLSICTKSHIIIILILYTIYFLKNNIKIKSIVIFYSILIVTVGSISLIGLQSEFFTQTVFFNTTQNKIFSLFIPYFDNKVYYVLPGIFLIFVLSLFRYVSINRHLFIIITGIFFSFFSLFIIPKPGWYFWFLPFFIYSILKHQSIKSYLFLIFQFFFIAFVILENLSLEFFTHKQNIFLSDIIFTFLQTSLLVHIFVIYQKELKINEHDLVGFKKPFVIGISGDSGSGKTYLVSKLTKILNQNNVTHLCGDAMHKWERGHQKWQEYTHLNPKANHLHHDYHDLQKLKNNQTIYRKTYDHDKGFFSQPIKTPSKPFILFEGLHPFYLKSMRSIIDLKIFLNPEEKIITNWKIERDTNKRKKNIKDVLKEIELRKSDKEKYITSQKQHSDIIFQLFEKKENDFFTLKILFNNTINIDSLLHFWENQLMLNIQQEYRDDLQQIIIESPKELNLSILNNTDSLPKFQDFLYPSKPQWPNGITGLMCYFIIYTTFKNQNY